MTVFYQWLGLQRHEPPDKKCRFRDLRQTLYFIIEIVNAPGSVYVCML